MGPYTIELFYIILIKMQFLNFKIDYFLKRLIVYSFYVLATSETAGVESAGNSI